MKACWMVVILAGCWVSTATLTQSSCTCNYHLETVCLPPGHSLIVPCPKLSGEIFRFKLFKNHKVIYNQSCNLNNNALNCTHAYSRAGVELLNPKAENNSVSFKLTTGVNSSGHGVYRCESVVTFPPPRRPPVHSAGKLVLVEGHQCEINRDHKDPEVDKDKSREYFWIWIVGLVSVIIYSVVITVCALFYWLKLKKTDSHSDYMNTKPRAPRGHKKNRGVQNPAPRYL